MSTRLDDAARRAVSDILDLAPSPPERPVDAAMLDHPAPRGTRLAAVAAAVLIIAGGVAVLLVQSLPDNTVPAERPRASSSPPTSTSSASTPPTTTRPTAPFPEAPEVFPVLPAGDPRNVGARGSYTQVSLDDAPQTTAAIARRVGDELVDGVTVTGYSELDESLYDGEATSRVVDGVDVTVYVDARTPAITTVLLPGPIAVRGIDPVGFLTAAGIDFVDFRVGTGPGGQVVLNINTLPDGYEIVTPPTPLPVGAREASLSLEDGNDVEEGASVGVSVVPPADQIAAATLRPVDINGTTGWASDDAGHTVNWPVGTHTWVTVAGVDSTDEALGLARDLQFVDEATWRDTYDVVDPEFPTNPSAGDPSATTPATAPPTGSAGSTSTTTTISTSTTVLPSGLDVNYLAPPPDLTPEVFGAVELEADGSAPQVAVFDGGVVVATSDGASLAVISWNGARRDVILAEPVGHLLAAGPGDVAYGLVQGPDAMDMFVNAYALSGPREGQVLARTAVDPNRFAELPAASIGHGDTGLIHRVREPGSFVAAYVDAAGQPVTQPDAPPLLTIDETDTVRSADGTTWALRITRDPTSPVPYEGWSAPAPSADGNGVYWTALGPPLDATRDFQVPTIDVIATLHPDGSATWQRLPDGWHVVASDHAGTILAAPSNGQYQLARHTVQGALPAPASTAVVVYDHGTIDGVEWRLIGRALNNDGQLIGLSGLRPVNTEDHGYLIDSAQPVQWMTLPVGGSGAVVVWVPIGTTSVTTTFYDDADVEVASRTVTDPLAAMVANGHPPAAAFPLPTEAVDHARITLSDANGQIVASSVTLSAAELVPHEPRG